MFAVVDPACGGKAAAWPFGSKTGGTARVQLDMISATH